MKLEIKTQNNIVIVKILEPELTSAKSPELKTELLRLAGEGKMNILLNLDSVAYMDSSGLSALLFGRRQIVPSGGNLKLACLSDNVKALIKIAQLDKIFDVFESVENALKAWGSDN